MRAEAKRQVHKREKENTQRANEEGDRVTIGKGGRQMCVDRAEGTMGQQAEATTRMEVSGLLQCFWGFSYVLVNGNLPH
jgi:hypothetical protein